MHPIAVIVVYRVWLVGETVEQRLIERLPLGYLVDEARYLIAVLITPRSLSQPVLRLVAIDAPMVVEVLLHLLHLFMHRLLSVFLHSCVESSVYFQAIAVEIIFWIPVIIAEVLLEIIRDILTEIQGLTIVVFLHLKVQHDWKLLKRIAFLPAQVTMMEHIGEHHIAAFLTVLWICLRVIH